MHNRCNTGELSKKQTQLQKARAATSMAVLRLAQPRTMVRRILEGDEELPPAIAETIRKAVGSDKKALQATIIVGLAQALQGEEQWAE